MPSWITETSLRAEHGLAHGSEVHLPEGARLTPSASQLLAERKIRIKYIGDDGRVFFPMNLESAPSRKRLFIRLQARTSARAIFVPFATARLKRKPSC